MEFYYLYWGSCCVLGFLMCVWAFRHEMVLRKRRREAENQPKAVHTAQSTNNGWRKRYLKFMEQRKNVVLKVAYTCFAIYIVLCIWLAVSILS